MSKIMNSIDSEWEDFMNSSSFSTQNKNFYSSSNEDNTSKNNNNNMDELASKQEQNQLSRMDIKNKDCPKASDIYISTKTKIAFLNMPIDLKNVFWKIPVIEYYKPTCGVIKKQMKFNSLCIEELQDIEERVKDLECCCDQYIITNINNPTGRIKFKDIRKISIGLSKKDIMSYRSKKKSAFYNCFVMIIRLNCQGIFQEFHVKVFNTGKIEIPGIQTEENFKLLLDYLIEVLTPIVVVENKIGDVEGEDIPIKIVENDKKTGFKTDTVLMNSNFNCGFNIDREMFYELLKMKYNIQSIYDPCSYPGIQCKIYYDTEENRIVKTIDKIEVVEEMTKKLVEVTFMVFRTGSILIVGKFDEDILYFVYEYIKNILIDEYLLICDQNEDSHIEFCHDKNKKTKIRKKTINMESKWSPMKDGVFYE